MTLRVIFPPPFLCVPPSATLESVGANHTGDGTIATQLSGLERENRLLRTPIETNRLLIRPFENARYGDISLIHNSRFADLPLSGEEMRFVDANRDPRCVLYRWVGCMESEWAGFSELTQSSETYHPTRFQFRICVQSKFEGNGLEEELFKPALETFRNHRGLSLRSVVREDQQAIISLLEKYGFTPSMRFLDKILNLEECDADRIQSMCKCLPDGISVKTLRELRSDPDCHRKLFELERSLRQDAPYPEDTSMRFDYFERAMMEHPGLLPDGYLVAVHDGRYVGLCSLSQREGNRTAYIHLTGVLPDYRKKGIARHLKAASICHARQAGFQFMFTANEENNRGIGDLNEQLGFQTVSSRVNWTKAF